LKYLRFIDVIILFILVVNGGTNVVDALVVANVVVVVGIVVETVVDVVGIFTSANRQRNKREKIS
jgi:hypothetical protein